MANLQTPPSEGGESIARTLLADTNVAKRQRPGVVALHRDVPAPGAAEVWPDGKLARLHLRFPVGAPEFVLQQLDAVQPVLDVRSICDNPRYVPLADTLQM